MRAALVALAGVTAFAAAALYFAPAALVVDAVPAAARLTQLEGRVWHGAGRLAYNERDMGRLTWRFDPGALRDGALGLSWRLADASVTLAGTVRATVADVAVRAEGAVQEAAIDRMLLPYHIDLGGAIAIADVDLRLSHDLRPLGGAGTLRWEGGAVRYRLAGERHFATLPPMVAEVAVAAGEGRLVVNAEDAPTPLIVARVDAAGWAHIGITQRFTELAGLPWPGRRAPADVVLEVSELLL